jgi:hypothetical protein
MEQVPLHVLVQPSQCLQRKLKHLLPALLCVHLSVDLIAVLEQMVELVREQIQGVLEAPLQRPVPAPLISPASMHMDFLSQAPLKSLASISKIQRYWRLSRLA